MLGPCLEACLPKEEEETVAIRFEGRKDIAMCAQIEPHVRAAVTAPDKPVVFDLEGVDFISSAFLRLCVYAWQQAEGHGFQIVNAGPCIKRVFKIAGLDRMFESE
jgi:anti-anti-sigma factor